MAQFLFAKNALLILQNKKLFEKQISYCSNNETLAVKIPAGHNTEI